MCDLPGVNPGEKSTWGIGLYPRYTVLCLNLMYLASLSLTFKMRHSKYIPGVNVHKIAKTLYSAGWAVSVIVRS